MDLLARMYHILRAKTAADQPPYDAANWADQSARREADWTDFKQAPPGAASNPSQDPVLAGYYANLELPYGADMVAVKTAWKGLMKLYHPDRHSQYPAKRRVANALSAELTRAYQELERSMAAG